MEKTDPVIRLMAKVHGQEVTAACGLNGEWTPNPHHLFVTPEVTIDNAIYGLNPDECLMSGGWKEDGSFIFKLKSLAAMGEYLFRLSFRDHAITLEIPRHVSCGKANLENAMVISSQALQSL